MSQRLPSVPNLGYLKKHAKDVLRVARHGNPRCRLTDAQHALARGYGFRSWPDLKVHIESVPQPDRPSGRQLRATRVTAASEATNVGHPMAGVWAAPHHETVVELNVSGDIVSLIQIAADATGEQMAVKMAIRADGRQYPFPFGNELVMQARWSDLRTLEMIVKHHDTIVSSGSYAVSDDGASLMVSTSGRVVVLARVSL